VSSIRVGAETEGTLTISADWRLDRSGAIPSLIIDIDPGSLTEVDGHTSWHFESLLNIGAETGTDLTLLYYLNGDDEG
jgi:hypothetical protein